MNSGKGSKLFFTWSFLIFFISNDEDKIPDDELPYGHPDRPKKALEFGNINLNDPGAMKKASRLNKNVIVLATISGDPTRFLKL